MALKSVSLRPKAVLLTPMHRTGGALVSHFYYNMVWRKKLSSAWLNGIWYRPTNITGDTKVALRPSFEFDQCTQGKRELFWVLIPAASNTCSIAHLRARCLRWPLTHRLVPSSLAVCHSAIKEPVGIQGEDVSKIVETILGKLNADLPP